MIQQPEGRSVVITGIGIRTPLGNDPKEVLERIASGETAARCPSRFDPTPFRCPLAAEISDFDPLQEIGDPKAIRMMGRDAQLAVAAAKSAVEDARIEVDRDYASHEMGLFGATGMAGISLEEVASLIRYSAGEGGSFDPRRFGTIGLKKVRPVLSFKILSNMPLCFVSILLGIQGPNAVLNPWESQGFQAIVEGIRGIEAGEFPCALVGGCDVKTHLFAFIGLQQRGLFESWTRSGKGMIPGEGAAFLVLEEEERALMRGATIIARIAGFGVGTIYGGENTRRNIREALLSCGLSPAGNQPLTVLSGDGGEGRTEVEERRALESMGFGSIQSVRPKAHLGNLFAAAAAAQVALAASAVSKGIPEAGTLAICSGHGGPSAALLLESHAASAPQEKKAAHLQNLRRRVVVTGIGITSPLGNDPEEFWRALTDGVSGIGPITLFDASSLPVRIAGEVKELHMEGLRRTYPEARGERDRKVWLGLAAAKDALLGAGLVSPDGSVKQHLAEASLTVGVSLEVFFLEDVTPFVRDPGLGPGLAEALLNLTDLQNPVYLQTPLDRLATILGNHYGIRGERITNCSACAAGAQVIGQAFHGIREGRMDLAVAGASDSILNPLGVGGFGLLGALSDENDIPTKACRPFDATRRGAVLGEGAAFLVLEEMEHAVGRGARILAEVLGYGSSLDAYRISDPEPSGRGAVLSMEGALLDARLPPEAVDAISAHGTGTPKNDTVETEAIKQVFGKRAKQIPVHAVKSMTGHLIAASGAVEALAAILTLDRGLVPPTINLDRPDPECDLDYVAGGSRPFGGKTVLTNSFGFGGQNASILFGGITP